MLLLLFGQQASGAQTLLPSLLTNEQTFYGGSISGGQESVAASSGGAYVKPRKSRDDRRKEWRETLARLQEYEAKALSAEPAAVASSAIPVTAEARPVESLEPLSGAETSELLAIYGLAAPSMAPPAGEQPVPAVMTVEQRNRDAIVALLLAA